MVLQEILSLIALHFISDWWFQTRKVAETKAESCISLLIHGTIICMVFCIHCYFFDYHYSAALINAILHICVDSVVWRSYKFVCWSVGITKETHDNGGYWFKFTIALDQALHLMVMFMIFTHAN